MTPQDLIIEKYSHHFPGPRTIECKGGWNKLIDDFLAELNGLPGGINLTIFCIKEKFGSLCIQLNPPYSEEAYELTVKYWERSNKVCDICGGPGKLRNKDWVQTRCDAHDD